MLHFVALSCRKRLENALLTDAEMLDLEKSDVLFDSESREVGWAGKSDVQYVAKLMKDYPGEAMIDLVCSDSRGKQTPHDPQEIAMSLTVQDLIKNLP